MRLLACLLALLLASPQARAVTDSEADAVAAAISRHLQQSYPLPEQAEAYAAMLTANIKAGRYHTLGDCALAAALTEDLRAIHVDKHLKITCKKSENEESERSGETRTPIDAVELDPVLPIAYIRSRGGWDLSDQTLDLVRHALNMAPETGYVILDLRDHPGGKGEIGTLIASYFLPLSDPIILVKSRTRGEGPSDYSYPFVPGLRLDDAKLFILVNNKTASAAEGLAFALQQRRRATIIGQTTAGAGIAGHPENLGHGLSLFLPTKLLLGPDGGRGWEGTGVLPDIVTAPGEEREVAMKLIQHDQPIHLRKDPNRHSPVPDLAAAPSLVAPIETCEGKSYDSLEKRSVFTNRCDRPLSLQFLAGDRQRVLWGWQLEPGDSVSVAYDREADNAWWISAACPLGYVSATPLTGDRRQTFIEGRYQCIKRSIVE